MARQKLPQKIDDCINCDLPSKLGVMSYLPCMNCRNKAVEECRRLECAMEELLKRANEKCNLADVNRSVCTFKDCKNEKIPGKAICSHHFAKNDEAN